MQLLGTDISWSAQGARATATCTAQTKAWGQVKALKTGAENARPEALHVVRLEDGAQKSGENMCVCSYELPCFALVQRPDLWSSALGWDAGDSTNKPDSQKKR